MNEKKTSTLAIVSMVLGICSVIFSILTAIPAVICGHMALKAIKNSDNEIKGRGFARTGLIIGYIIIALSIVLGLLIFLASCPETEPFMIDVL